MSTTSMYESEFVPSNWIKHSTAFGGSSVMLDKPPTVEEAIVKGGLDWPVALEQLHRPNGEPVDRFAVVRGDTNASLGTVGTGYRPLQIREAFAPFAPLVEAGLVDLKAAGAIKGGSRVWILGQVRNGGHANAEILPGDTVENHLLLAHGHDGSLGIHFGNTPWRGRCSNHLGVALVNGIRCSNLLRIRHTSGARDALDAARETIMRANANFDATVKVFRAFAGVCLRNGAQLRAYIDIVFPQPKTTPIVQVPGIDAVSFMSDVRAEESNRLLVAELSDTSRKVADSDRRRIYDEIEALFETGRGTDVPGVKGTAWGAYNAVTEYLTHERGRNADNRLNTTWFGPESQRAIQGAVDTFLK